MPNNSNSAVFCGKKRAISKVLALLLTATALYMLWGIWIPIIKTHEFNSLFDLIFLFIFPVPSTFLAIYFLHTATILRRGISARGIHKFSVCLSLLFAALVLVIFLGIKKFISPSKNFFWMEFPTAFVMIAAGIFFLPVKRGLLRCFSVTDVFDYDAYRKATKLYFGFLAFFIWSAISATAKLLPKHPDHEHLPANHWVASLIIFGSIPLAFWSYRIGLKMFLKNPPKGDDNDMITLEVLGAESSPA